MVAKAGATVEPVASAEFDIVGGSKKPVQVKSKEPARDSTYSADMRALSKMPQNMGLEEVGDADGKGPFDLADPQRKSVAPNADFSQEISQIVNGQKISPIFQNGFQGAPPGKMSGFGGVMASGNTDSTAKFDEEESLLAYQEMIKNINH